MSKKLSIDLSNTQNFKTLVPGESTISDAFALSIQADHTESRVNGAKASVFDVLRHDLVDIYRRALTAAKDDPTKVDTGSVVGRFLNLVDDAKASFSLPAGAKSRTFDQYVSDLKGAVEIGVNLAEHAQSARNKINSAAKEIRDAIATQLDEERKAAAKADGQGDKGKGAVNHDPDAKAPVDNNDDKSQASEPSGKAPASAPSGTHNLTPEEIEAATKLIEMLDTIKGANPAKFEKMMTNISGQVEGAFKAAMSKLAVVSGGKDKKAANG